MMLGSNTDMKQICLQICRNGGVSRTVITVQKGREV